MKDSLVSFLEGLIQLVVSFPDPREIVETVQAVRNSTLLEVARDNWEHLEFVGFAAKWVLSFVLFRCCVWAYNNVMRFASYCCALYVVVRAVMHFA